MGIFKKIFVLNMIKKIRESKIHFNLVFITLIILCVLVNEINLEKEFMENKIKGNITYAENKQNISATEDPNFPANSLIPEINNLKDLKKYFAENKLFIYEVFSAKCPHCIHLAPSLETIMTEYKGKIKFIKTDALKSTDYKYVTTKVTHFPALFIYKDGHLTELVGDINYTTLKVYIEEKYFFTCKKINSSNELKKTITNLSNK